MSGRPLDSDSLRYARYWEPVLAPPAVRLLQRIDVQPERYLDVGAGTGSLVLVAAARWPHARIAALDASGAALAVARERAAEARPGGDPTRYAWLPADAADIPLEESSVDVATSSFMLQLVADRAAVLVEVRRVLRPGGVFGWVTWLAGELRMAADDAFAAALTQAGLQPAHDDLRSPGVTDYETLEQAREELRAAGFDHVDVLPEELHASWTRETYLEFKEHYDEHELFDSLDDDGRDRLREAVRAAFAELPRSAFEVRAPLVSATAHKPLAP